MTKSGELLKAYGIEFCENLTAAGDRCALKKDHNNECLTFAEWAEKGRQLFAAEKDWPECPRCDKWDCNGHELEDVMAERDCLKESLEQLIKILEQPLFCDYGVIPEDMVVEVQGGIADAYLALDKLKKEPK